MTEEEIKNGGEDEIQNGQLAEMEERWKRALADLDNMRKRTEREFENLRKYACEPLLLDVLRSMEDIERALESAGSANDDIVGGLEMILADMKGTMEKYGVIVIPSVGSGFDPGQHECVMQSETSSSDEADTIVEEVQRGYKLHDKVIKHAKVKVAKHKGGEPNGASR